VFFAADKADLVILATPIHLHAEQTCLALAHGSHVLCEKPLCATVPEARQMIAAEQASDKFVAIGYQWSFSEAIQALKHDIMTGELGRPLRFKARILWPRWQAYYRRNRWAGRIKTDDGRWVLDSPVNNATAHYLHNLFYLLGPSRETSTQPTSVQAELYRANAIENYDTAALRCQTEAGVELLFYTAHPVCQTVNPIFDLEFEAATVSYAADGPGEIIATFNNGTEKNYGDPFADNTRKLWQSVAATRRRATLPCGPVAAMAQTVCMNGAQASMPTIVDFPADLITTEGDRGWVAGLEEILTDCYQRNILPSERASSGGGNISWAKAGQVIDLQASQHFELPPGLI
jgi:predicted dehydrogenase